jgi:hypothetical protein
VIEPCIDSLTLQSDQRKARRIIILITQAVLSGLLLITWVVCPTWLVWNSFVGYACVAGLVFHLSLRPSKLEFCSSFVLGSLISLLFRLHLPWILEQVAVLFCFSGLSSLFVIAFVAIWSPRKRRAYISVLIPGVILVIASSAAIYALIVGLRHNRTVYDLTLFRYDQIVWPRLQSLIVGSLVTAPPLARLSMMGYRVLLLAFAILYVLHRAAPSRQHIRLASAFFVAAVAGYLVYAILPACGPRYLHGHPISQDTAALAIVRLKPATSLAVVQGSNRLATTQDIVSAAGQLSPPAIDIPTAPRNAMPSLHFGWALLLFWSSWLLPRYVRVYYGLLLFLTVAATIGFGEHYVIDLIVAVPFAVCIEAITIPPVMSAIRDRVIVSLCGAVLTVGWILMIRFSTPDLPRHPVLLWISVLATLVCSLTMRSRTATNYRWVDIANVGQLNSANKSWLQ